MIYYIHAKTITEFMDMVNLEIARGDKLLEMRIAEGFHSYVARMDTTLLRPPKQLQK